MRNTFAKVLYEIAREDERVVVVVADISPAGAMDALRREFPRRFINVGVAEQAMIGLAAGLAQRGFRPVCYTIAPFALLRPYEFIRCDLAYQYLPVTIVGMGAGLSYPTLGGTHQAIEDVAVAMACPDLTVLAPCDPAEVVRCARWCASRPASAGPVYLRLGKSGEPDLPDFSASETGADRLRWMRYAGRGTPGKADSLILSYGSIAETALSVAQSLDADMVAITRLAPLPGAIASVSRLYRRVIVVEEASGGPLAAALREEIQGPAVASFALPRKFPHHPGTRAELLDWAGLTVEKIVGACSGNRARAGRCADEIQNDC